MEIGKPQRIYRVEPLKQPVPQKREPAAPPRRVREEPKPVPAR